MWNSKTNSWWCLLGMTSMAISFPLMISNVLHYCVLMDKLDNSPLWQPYFFFGMKSSMLVFYYSCQGTSPGRCTFQSATTTQKRLFRFVNNNKKITIIGQNNEMNQFIRKQIDLSRKSASESCSESHPWCTKKRGSAQRSHGVAERRLWEHSSIKWQLGRMDTCALSSLRLWANTVETHGLLTLWSTIGNWGGIEPTQTHRAFSMMSPPMEKKKRPRTEKRAGVWERLAESWLSVIITTTTSTTTTTTSSSIIIIIIIIFIVIIILIIIFIIIIIIIIVIVIIIVPIMMTSLSFSDDGHYRCH